MYSPYAAQPHYHEVGMPPAQQEQQPDPEIKAVWWPWRIFTALASNMLLLGYLILPVAFEAEKPNIQIDKTSITTVGLVFIAVAYLLSIIMAMILGGESSFLLHSLFLPCLYSSLLGLFSVVFNILCRNLYPVSTIELASICMSGVSGFLYALAGLWMYGKGISVPSRSKEYREGEVLLTEDERQRQQLATLLQQREGKRKSSRKTFMVDTPDSLMPTFTPPPRYST